MGGSSYGTGGRGGAASYGSTSFLGSYYVNPFSMGMPSSTNAPSGSTSFGQALYNTSTGGATGRGGRGGGATTFGATGVGTVGRGGYGTTSTTGTFNGATSMGTYRNPTYVAVLGFRPAPPAPPIQIQSTVQQSLARSTQMTPGGAVRVEMDGSVVVLKGSVADEQERRHAEAVARLTPGVREVRNELVPRETTAGQQ
jgi:hypothetical protein